MTRESRKKNRESRNMWMYERMEGCMHALERMNQWMNEWMKKIKKQNERRTTQEKRKKKRRRKDGKKERRKEGRKKERKKDRKKERKKDRKKERSNETRKQWNNAMIIYLYWLSVAGLWMHVQVQLLLRDREFRCGATSSTLCMLGNVCSWVFNLTNPPNLPASDGPVLDPSSWIQVCVEGGWATAFASRRCDTLHGSSTKTSSGHQSKLVIGKRRAFGGLCGLLSRKGKRVALVWNFLYADFSLKFRHCLLEIFYSESFWIHWFGTAHFYLVGLFFCSFVHSFVLFFFPCFSLVSFSVCLFMCLFIGLLVCWHVRTRYDAVFQLISHENWTENCFNNMVKPLAQEIPCSSKLWPLFRLPQADSLQRRPEQSTPQRGLPSWLATSECDDHSCAAWLGDYRGHAHLKKGPCLVCLHRLGQRCWIPASSLTKFGEAMSFGEQLDFESNLGS